MTPEQASDCKHALFSPNNVKVCKKCKKCKKRKKCKKGKKCKKCKIKDVKCKYVKDASLSPCGTCLYLKMVGFDLESGHKTRGVGQGTSGTSMDVPNVGL